MPRLVLALALAQFLAPFFPRLTGIGGEIGARTTEAGLPAPETPAGYAFGIWFPIFVLGLVYAVGFWRDPANESYRRVAPYAGAMFAFGTAWMLWTQMMGSGLMQLPLIFGMFVSTLLGWRHVDVPGDKALPVLFGLQAGWLSAAVCLNTTSWLRNFVGGTPFGLSPEIYALATLLPAAAIALAAIFSGRANIWYVAAMVWALAGIAVSNINGERFVLIAALALIAPVLLAFSVRTTRVPAAR
ncbi:MAG: hypothetical protein IBJ15_03200 [Alphaproteobacteria bacterium]|nr:hypothetical protein [Alphaproteobacteria bacterium]